MGSPIKPTDLFWPIFSRSRSNVEVHKTPGQQHEDIDALAQAKADFLSQPLWDMKITPTHIDRRQCHRVRPMEVLCLGLERTGTVSLKVALLRLGYYDVYHMSSVLGENPRDADMWLQAFAAKYDKAGTFEKQEWDQLLGHCMAVSDQPCARFAPELMAAYPEAKVILTVRDTPADWAQSIRSTIYPLVRLIMPLCAPKSWLAKLFVPSLPTAGFMMKLEATRDYNDVAARAEESYTDHCELVRRLAREQNRQFLEFNAKHGWAPLCEFLGKPVPDLPYPNLNDKEEYARKIQSVRRMVLVLYAVNIARFTATAAVFGWFTWKIWKRII